MSEFSNSQSSLKRERGLLERLSWMLLREPEDREQLIEILQQAHERSLLDADALSMIEGVMQVSELSVRDVMIPRGQMDMIDVSSSMQSVIDFATETAHSRFPVFENTRDNVIGVLLAKDLLQAHAAEEKDFDLRDMLRPAVFIPESKRLNVLLHDFRQNRNHIALVVDEFGGVAGLVTIEDVLEQIVGDIEDEYDFDEEEDNIVSLEGAESGTYRVRALTELEQFNEVFAANYSDEQSDTIGGLLADHLGRVPRKGEVVLLPPFKFEVLRADARQPHMLKVQQLAQVEALPESSDSEPIEHFDTKAANS